jgi:hypothetical protein
VSDGVLHDQPKPSVRVFQNAKAWLIYVVVTRTQSGNVKRTTSDANVGCFRNRAVIEYFGLK